MKDIIMMYIYMEEVTDFGFGLNSTSTIESLWNALKKN
jgi:hypothetical protein